MDTDQVNEIRLLPKVLYISDIPVTNTVGGAAVLYRLFKNYPPDRLHIIQSTPADVEKRLPKVVYHQLSHAFGRLRTSRFTKFYAAYCNLSASLAYKSVGTIIQSFRPEAIVTVAQGTLWITAYRASVYWNIPLHILVHDDFYTGNNLPGILRNWYTNQFGQAYRRAKSRLCVSTGMIEYLERKFGVRGTLVYPLRSSDDKPVFNLPVQLKKELIYTYFGSMHNLSTVQSIIQLGEVLNRVSGKLIVYSADVTLEQLQKLGLTSTTVVIKKPLPLAELKQVLAQETDVLFLAMSFDEVDQLFVSTSFPSKLTEYTALGLPILLYAPAYSTAVCWANENPGVAQVVTQHSEAALSKAVQELNMDEELRARLAKGAFLAGNRYFSHQAIVTQFYQYLAS